MSKTEELKIESIRSFNGEQIEKRDYGLLKLYVDDEKLNEVKSFQNKLRFIFEYCTFDSLEIHTSHQITKEIEFIFDYCSIKNVRVIGLIPRNLSFSFINCCVTGKLVASRGCFSNVDFSNTIFKDLTISGVDTVGISFSNNYFYPENWEKVLLHQGGQNIKELLSIHQEISIFKCQALHLIGIEEAKYKSDDEVVEMCSQKLDFNLRADMGSEVIEGRERGVMIHGGYYKSIEVNGGVIDQFDISNCSIHSLQVSYTFVKKSFTIFNLNSFNNIGSYFILNKCRLSNIVLDSIEFPKYEDVIFYKTSLLDATIYSCEIPEKLINIKDLKDKKLLKKEKFLGKSVPFPSKDQFYKDQYEMYLQLQQVFSRTKNIQEVDKINAISKKYLRMISKTSFSDKFILWISEKSNSHALSIKRPLIGFFVFTIALYLVYLFSIGKLFKPTDVDWNLIGYYFSFIDLTHKNTFLVEKSELNGWAITIDYVNKLFAGFFIYQFIAAFRKYGKK